MIVLCESFSLGFQLVIRVVAKSAGSEYLILHLWMPYFSGRSFETGNFYTEKRVREP
jgi:hypothetical protein